MQTRDFPGSVQKTKLSFYYLYFFPSLTLASYPSVSWYWFCKKERLWVHYSQLGKSGGSLLLLSHPDEQEGFWWQGEQAKGRVEQKTASGRWGRCRKAQSCEENILSLAEYAFAQSIMERKSLSNIINISSSSGYAHTHKWLKFHSCGLLLYQHNLELYL